MSDLLTMFTGIAFCAPTIFLLAVLRNAHYNRLLKEYNAREKRRYHKRK